MCEAWQNGDGKFAERALGFGLWFFRGTDFCERFADHRDLQIRDRL